MISSKQFRKWFTKLSRSYKWGNIFPEVEGDKNCFGFWSEHCDIHMFAHYYSNHTVYISMWHGGIGENKWELFTTKVSDLNRAVAKIKRYK